MNYRKATAGIVSIIALMAAMPMANAQTANSTSGAVSGSNADSSSRSGAVSRSQGGASDSRSNATNSASQGVNANLGVTVDQRSTGGGQSGVNYSGGTNNYSTERQTGDVTVRTTPTVYAPPVSGGNPCTLAVSGGVSVIGWGAAAGGTFVDEDCATRQKIAMIHNAGYAQAARELMCNDKATYYAFRSTQTPCSPRAQFDGVAAAGTPAPAPQPMPIAPPQRVTTVQQAPPGRFVCLDNRGREVSAGTPGASCGQI